MTTKKKVTNPRHITGTGCKQPHGIITFTGKPATILYKNLPDNMILITGFENFLTLEEIMDKYGRVVMKAYADFPYHMSGITGAIFLAGLGDANTIAISQIYSKIAFAKVISHIKKCGCLLHNIIAEVNKGQVKRIEI